MSTLPHHNPSGTGAPSTIPSYGTAPTGAAHRERNPSPPLPLAGRKRDLHDGDAHVFQNGKLPKLHFYDHVVPLELSSNAVPPGGRTGRVAPMPAQAPSGQARAEQPREPMPDPQAARYAGAAQVPGYHPGAPYPHGFGMQGNPPFGPQPPTAAAGHAPAYPLRRAHSYVSLPARAFNPSQGLYGEVPFAPAHPQMYAFSPAHVFPQGAVYGMDPNGYPHDHVHGRASYATAHAQMGESSGHYATQPVPQARRDILMDWEQHPPPRTQPVHQVQQQHAWSEEAAMPSVNSLAAGSGDRADPAVSGSGSNADPAASGSGSYADPVGCADAVMNIDHGIPYSSGKGKGKATNRMQVTVEDDVDEEISPLEEGLSSQPEVDHMTTNFGVMLLDHVQQSNDQMNKMMSEFMKQQSEAQERLRHTLAHEVHAVHAKVAQLQNPLPLHGHRRGGFNSPQSSPARKTPASPATPKRVRADRAKPPALASDAEDILTTLKASVRAHLKQMLNFTTWEELVSRQPPLSDAELKAYRTGKKSLACNKENFRIDFIQDWKRLPLNLAARDFFVQDMLKCIKGGAFDFDPKAITSITEDHVQYALDSHMEYCRTKYREAYNRQSWDSEDDDDAQKIAEQDEKAEQVKKRKAINSRKKTLFDARLCVILEKGLTWHALLFTRLLPQNMSGDETDGPERKLPMAYRIIESQWQSVVLKTFLRALDAIYRKSWGRPQPGKRATGGNPPRTRVSRADGRVEEGYAPAGLWRNCYDRDWLRTLEPYRRRALKIVNADYDFDLTPEPADDGVDLDVEDDEEVEVEDVVAGEQDDDQGEDLDAEGSTDRSESENEIEVDS